MKARIIIDIEFNDEPLKSYSSYRNGKWPNGFDYLRDEMILPVNHNRGVADALKERYRSDVLIVESVTVEEVK